ncbi:hypothetical protein ACP70R_043511 [Stipagrostis hirtigluma subsp. patula]
MAAEHRGAAPIHQQQDDGVLDPGRRDDHAQQLRLDAGRVLVLFGGPVVAMPAPGSPGGAANATAAVVGFLLWILGVCLLTAALTPAARPFPLAARAGAAVASTVLKCFFLP